MPALLFVVAALTQFFSGEWSQKFWRVAFPYAIVIGIVWIFLVVTTAIELKKQVTAEVSQFKPLVISPSGEYIRKQPSVTPIVLVAFVLIWGMLLPLLLALRAAFPKHQATATSGQAPTISNTANRGLKPKSDSPRQRAAIKTPNRLKLIFKSSPLLTDARRSRITSDMCRFRSYLEGLDIPVPLETPPIGVNTKGTWVSSRQGNAPDYLNALAITANEVDNPSAATFAYCSYVLSVCLHRNQPASDDELFVRMVAAGYFTEYLNWSFWGKPLPGFEFAATKALWDARCRLGKKFADGKQFADQVVAYAIRAFNDAPNRNFKQNRELFFYLRLKDGDSVIDNEAARMRIITETWVSHGLPVQ